MVNRKPVAASEIEIPTTYKQAEKTPHWQYWKQAMEDQIEDLNAKNTYTLIIRPRKTQVLLGQWRFSIKKDAYDYATGFKARWAACGNFQKKDEAADYYAPVVAECLVKTVLSIIAVYGLKWRQVDVKAAYLNASREEETTVYMRQPTGFEYFDDEGSTNDWVCVLNQALYALRDSAFLWNQELDEKLQLLGFLPLDDDACVYTKGSGSQMSILKVHVDDFIIAAPTDAEVSTIADGIKGFFPIKDLGEPAVFLGCALSGTTPIALSQ
jgi:hypothetical protein